MCKLTMQYYLNKSFYILKYLLVSLLVSLLSNFTNATSQGKLGIQSSASIDISVMVTQSLSTVTPTELLLNDCNNCESTSMPFCIAHHGLKEGSSVPYSLSVDSLEPSHQESRTLPYKIYLEDKDTKRNKLLLHSGTVITKQSTLNVSKKVINECAENGMKLSIEMDVTAKKSVPTSASAGLMILLASPY